MTWFNKDSHCSLRAQDSVYTNGRQDFRLMISKQEILKDANLLNCKVELISYLSADFLDFINSTLQWRLQYREIPLLAILAFIKKQFK